MVTNRLPRATPQSEGVGVWASPLPFKHSRMKSGRRICLTVRTGGHPRSSVDGSMSLSDPAPTVRQTSSMIIRSELSPKTSLLGWSECGPHAGLNSGGPHWLIDGTLTYIPGHVNVRVTETKQGHRYRWQSMLNSDECLDGLIRHLCTGGWSLWLFTGNMVTESYACLQIDSNLEVQPVVLRM